MATVAKDSFDSSAAANPSRRWGWRNVVGGLASLKLTVALFAASLIIVLVGTLAQDELNMLEVKQRYFTSWIAAIPIDDFFPQAFFPHESPIPGVIPFPGGALIGMLLIVNLIAAKATRFKISARGGRRIAGIGFLALGALLTTLVVTAGHNDQGLQGTPPIRYETLWGLVLATLTAGSLGLGWFATVSRHAAFRIAAFVAATVLGVWVAYALATDTRIGDPGLRIVWQLTKGIGAGLVLLIGCNLLFDRRGGNVLLHLGVGLLMVGQFAFGDRQVEQNLSLVEGQKTNTFINRDRIELAFIEEEADRRWITAVPAGRLASARKDNVVISDETLPVDVRVIEYYRNSDLKRASGQTPADKGFGLRYQAVESPPVGGAEMEENIASGYVELLDRDSGASIGRYLISQYLGDGELLSAAERPDEFESIEVGGKTFKMGLRFHREVKPYWVKLEDVRRINYSGTATPRDYSSFIRIVDKETGEDRQDRVWMNNPLRYRGETFYQSNYTALPGGKEMTGIQVVRNSGWLIPYVACSVIALGMLAHFWGTLVRFVRRRERETRAVKEDFADAVAGAKSSVPVWLTIVAMTILSAVMLVPWDAVRYSMRPATRLEDFDFHTAGKIPVQADGRIKPLDAYARQTLKAISNRESLELPEDLLKMRSAVGDDQLSAMRWLMEVAIDRPELRQVPMIRIDADEVRTELGVERRKSKLYSLDEVSDGMRDIEAKVKRAREKDNKDRSFKERKLLELDQRLGLYSVVAFTFRLPIPEDIPAEEFEKAFPGASERARLEFAMDRLRRRLDAVRSMQTPGLVAPSVEQAAEAVDGVQWDPFAPAFFDHYSQVVTSGDAGDPRPGIDTFSTMIRAYGEKDPVAFNRAVDDHMGRVQAYPIPGYDVGLVGLERWVQSNRPTRVALVVYLLTLALGLLYFFARMPRLRLAVWGTLGIAASIHTVAILCGVAITGRAPVINLYSSAVFIGWAAVLFGLAVERIFKYGTGNVLAATSGMLSLLVAYGLNKGDTMPVLRAVLDTQFWLATHVISVSLGYVATMVAGFLGIGFLIAGWTKRDSKWLRDLYRCCYGAACFGILFSTIGTILGGLWADDSWGRFWGWDPKENGALLIVIWNALILHARWDGMVAGRGFAGLAIVGNIITAWSWFGTNELGIGLHSYGFTEGTLFWLGWFVASQLAVLVADQIWRQANWRFGAPA